MTAPAVILRTGKPVQTDPDAVVLVIDHRTIWRGSESERFTHTEFRICFALLSAQGNVVNWDDLIDFVFFDNENGGPEDIRNAIFVWRCRMRHRLMRLGIEISTRPWLGLYASFLPVASSFREAAE